MLIQAAVPTCRSGEGAPRMCTDVGQQAWVVAAWASAIVPIVALVLARRISRVPAEAARRAATVPLAVMGAEVVAIVALGAVLL